MVAGFFLGPVASAQTAAWLLHRGTQELDDGKLDSAFRDFSGAISINPDYAFAWHNRGVVRMQRQDYPGAIADFTKAVSLDSDLAEAVFDRGEVYYLTGDYPAAVADFTDAIARAPHSWKNYTGFYPDKALRFRAMAYWCLGQTDRALADLDDAIRQNSKDNSQLVLRGHLHFSAGDFAAAKTDYERAQERGEHGDTDLFRYLAGRRAGGDTYDLAGAIKRKKPNPWIREKAAFFLGQVTESALLEEARKGDADTAAGHICEAWYCAGMQHLFSGDTGGAKTCFEACLATSKKRFSEYQLAQAELARIAIPRS